MFKTFFLLCCVLYIFCISKKVRVVSWLCFLQNESMVFLIFFLFFFVNLSNVNNTSKKNLRSFLPMPSSFSSLSLNKQKKKGAGKWFHKKCFKCFECRRQLDSNKVDRNGEMYCQRCYSSMFSIKGYGFSGGGAGAMGLARPKAA